MVDLADEPAGSGISVTFERCKLMNLFNTQKPQANAEQITQVKRWVYATLASDPEIPVSISQLACHEPGCPPLETVITLMTQPPTKYTVHKGVNDITLADVQHLQATHT
jgi:hypothetical protein